MEKTTEHTTMEMSTEGTAIRIGDENRAHSNKNRDENRAHSNKNRDENRAHSNKNGN